MSYEAHPAADLFPMLGEDDLLALANDISENGLNEPIMLHEGKILDGRNRLAACQIVDVEPSFQTWAGQGGTPVRYVVSQNLHRRHLTTSQRAAVAVEMLPMLEEEAKERQGGSGRFGHGSSSNDEKPEDDDFDAAAKGRQGWSVHKAGSLMGVGAATVSRAKRVKAMSPETFEQIKAGKTTANGAYDEVVLGKDPKRPTKTNSDKYVPETPHQHNLAEGQKRRMVDGLSHTDGLCRGLRNLKIPMVIAVCTPEEVAIWARKADEIATEFKSLSKRLREANYGG